MFRLSCAVLTFFLLFPAQFTVAATDNYQLAFSEGFTGSVVDVLEGGISQCQAIDAVYQFDCYRQSFRSAVSKMNGKPDYRSAQRALKDVEQVLKSIVQQNRDKTTRPIKVNGRTYKAVLPSAVKAGNAAFSRARADAVTVLLRAQGPEKLHYARIADVVGSNKVFIRSKLIWSIKGGLVA